MLEEEEDEDDDDVEHEKGQHPLNPELDGFTFASLCVAL